METILIFIGGAVVGVALTAMAVEFVTRKTYSSDTKAIIRRRGDKLVVEPKKTYHFFEGEHTFELKDRSVAVSVEFVANKKGISDPFGGKGKYSLDASTPVIAGLKSTVDPGKTSEYWDYKVTDGQGNTIDPGLRVKR